MIKHSSHPPESGRESPQDSRDPHPSLGASLPAPAWGLEETSVARAGVWAPAAGFAVARLAEAAAVDARPVLIAAPPWWLHERGRPFGPGLVRLGLPRDRWLLVRADKEAALLWAVEEALKSGAVSGALACVEAPSLVMTRRLDLSARQGRALGMTLRIRPAEDLSAARVRWRVEAVKRRDGPPATWLVEIDDETHRLRVAPGLADHAPVRDASHRAA